MLNLLLVRGEKIHNRMDCASPYMWLVLALAVFCALPASAQTNPPSVSIFRSYVNDIRNDPIVTVTVSGASNVSCFTVEEILPAPATALDVSGDGVWLPALNAIRWGPYFNTITTNVQ